MEVEDFGLCLAWLETRRDAPVEHVGRRWCAQEPLRALERVETELHRGDENPRGHVFIRVFADEVV